jgi:hypothetical protein
MEKNMPKADEKICSMRLIFFHAFFIFSQCGIKGLLQRTNPTPQSHYEKRTIL